LKSQNDKITFILNGEKVSYAGNPMDRLVDVLRENFEFTGVKEGCGEGECGACSVLLDGKNVPSCIIPVATVQNKEIYTVEGLREVKMFQILVNSFADAGAVQCGFCTPGMMISAYALLQSNNNPTDDEIREAISGNFCRCTGMNMIIEAIKLAVNRLGETE